MFVFPDRSVTAHTFWTSLEPYHFFSNPALLFFIAPSTVQVSLSPSRFGLQELQSIQGFFVLPELHPSIDKLRFGVSLQGAGNTEFSELSTSLQSSFFVSEPLQIGGEITYARFNLLDTKPLSQWSFTFGTIWSFDSLVTVGVSFQNSVRFPSSGSVAFSTQDVKLVCGTNLSSFVSFDLGVRYFSFSGFSEQKTHFVSLNLVALFTVHEILKLRTAWVSNPALLDVSAYLQFEQCTVIFNSALHLWLGLSHRFGIQYCFNSNQ